MAVKNCVVRVGATFFEMSLIRSFNSVDWNSHSLDYNIILMDVI